MIADSSHVLAGQIRTDFVSFSNRAGLRLAACLDHTGHLRSRPWVVVAPKYGETKKNNLQLAYHLVANGLNVLRFDHTNHVGESEGRMLNFSLPGAVEDISSALDFLTASYGMTSLAIVANSLSARCALRAAAHDPRVARFIAVAGVVNLLATMSEIYKEDILAQYRQGRRWGVTDFLGFDVHGDTFLDSVVHSNLHGLEGTLEDIALVRAPVTFFYAERDPWVRREEVERVVGENPRARLVLIEGAMHEVRENPRAAERLSREVIWACLHDTPCPANAGEPLAQPNKKLLVEQNRRERERMRRSEAPVESETKFWSDYLAKYSILERSSDYQAYISLLGRLCRPLAPGALVLDAGCGNGVFGLWVLHEARERGQANGLAHPVVYVGLDLTRRGLADAMGKHGDLPVARSSGHPPGRGYALVDFDQLDEGGAATTLPFLDGTFDLVCCSLVLSYLKRPQGLLRELYRVLRPGGILITSSMKPHCDLSLIYRDSIDESLTAGELDAGRNLLRAAGKIKLKEEIGYYTFFSESELAGLVAGAGFNVSETHHSLGDQAVVVKAGK